MDAPAEEPTDDDIFDGHLLADPGIDAKLQAFKVSKVVEPKSGKVDAVDVPVPQAYIEAARRKAEAKHLQPKLEDGKPVEFFTYFFYTPRLPATVITDLDQPLDKQP